MTLLEFLESIGFAFHLDWDGELEIEYPEELTIEQFATELGNKCRQDLRACLLARERLARSRFYGGPYDGQGHMRRWYVHGCVGTDGKLRPITDYFLAMRHERARWACYRLLRDGRAYFVGYAKSEQKARRGEVFEKPRKVPPPDAGGSRG